MMLGEFLKSSHARWLAIFTLVLCVSCAAPVLAESPNVGVGRAQVADAPARPAATDASPSSAPEGDAPSEEVSAPNPAALTEEVEKAEGEERARAEWLETPEAVRQREESRTAFDDLSAAEAKGVLGSVFAEAMKQLDGDPARALSEMQIEVVVNENGALVSDGEGGKELVESPIPIRSKVPGEEGKRVDLDLKESDGGFESKSPATDIRLPASLGGQIEVGEELAISSLPGSGEVAATRFGDKDLFYPNTDTDTDTFIAPLARSAEVFQQLRSPKSPERFRYGLTLPKGTTLRSDGNGGAEVVDAEGKRVASVPPPFATDAQGTEVPVSMAIEGDSVTIEIAHRSMDVAYPLLLDPELVNDAWYWEGNGPAGLEFWKWSETANYEDSHWCGKSCWGWGLYARSKGENHWYGGNTRGQWVYTAPNSTAYIKAATFWTIKGNSYNCIVSQPHGYVGIYNVNSSSYSSLGVYSPPSGYSPDFQTGWVGGPGTRLAVVGIGTGSNPSQLSCGHDFYVAGALINQTDDEHPGASLSGMPGGWIGANTPAFTIAAHGSDSGLGVKKITLTREGGSNSYERPVGCNGTAGSRCPEYHSEYFNVSAASFDEGKKDAKIAVEDALDKVTNYTWQTYVDTSQPNVTLDGKLAEATEDDKGEAQGNDEVEELSLPVYNLNIHATDIGTEANPNHKMRSGVRKIEILLDGVKKQEWEQSCSHSCPMEKGYALKLNDLEAAEEYALEVFVTDFAGNVRERKIEFQYIPATGMKDEYVMHYFPLPDGQGNEAEEEHPDRPELAVNVMNGNLVYREKDVEVEGYSANLEVERYYNSLLPEEENTEWGDGWTLSQTPDLETGKSEGGPPASALMIRRTGAVEGSVELPESVGGEEFDPELQAVVTREPGGGYEVADATGESGTALAFDEDGRVEELRTEGSTSIDYSYENGVLSEVAVEDPASTNLLPEEVEEPLGPIEPPTYAKSFGSSGHGDGQFISPAGFAADPQGDVWVVDSTKNRVQRFDSEGKYLGKFGSYGSANGQFSMPSGIATDPEGDVWVLDFGNSRLQEFTPSGQYIQKIDFPTEEIEEELVSPLTDFTVDPEGNVWVLEGNDDRVKKFDSDGEYLIEFGSSGSGVGQFDWPTRIQADSQGGVWVVDNASNRFQQFDSNGEYLGQIGFAKGWVVAMATDPEGHLWVLDANNSCVESLAPDGSSLAQFGSYGAGAGQAYHPTDLVVDEQGNFWVLAYNNSQRLQKWVPPNYSGTLHAGSIADDEEQLQGPADVEVDAEGNLWVADEARDRIEKLGPQGEPLFQFGSLGSANGQLDSPSALAFDPEGNLWVADSGNDRIQKFGPEGEYLAKVGTQGSGNAQFGVGGPADVAVDPEGNVWVADSTNHRLQKFDAEGQFLEAWSEEQIALEEEPLEPTALDIGPNGSVWIADRLADQIVGFGKHKGFLRRIGGWGPLLEDPEGVEIDYRGDIWVADSGNDRVQLFDREGAHVLGFGEGGSGEAQLSAPAGVVSDGRRVWVADIGNQRLQSWVAGAYIPTEGEEALSDDPVLEVQSDDGLIASAEGEEAGEHTYEHEDGLLTAHDGPLGETQYEYDEAGRMTRVELPNGTWAEIEYGTSDGRVIAVTVDPEGAETEKTTEFSYVDSPDRETTVTLPNDPKVHYQIGDDGSVFRWSNAKEPPELQLAGTLVDVENKETAAPINVGDYELKVMSHAEEGMESVQIYANGSQLLTEKHCPAEELCKDLPDEWVTYTGSHPPGILNIEVVVEDRLEQVASERFWVNIPYTPPPPPGQPVKPQFPDVLEFREEHGLDLDLDPVKDEFELNDRVFDTINDWVEGRPVARASWERWGVPLRTPEVAELEYRLAYWKQAMVTIPAWTANHAPSTFAGFYLDEQAGGKIRVGFTGGSESQEALVNSLIASGAVVAADRIAAFSNPPEHSLAEIELLAGQVQASIDSFPSNIASRAFANIQENRVTVIASNVADAQSRLSSAYGGTAPISVISGGPLQARGDRERVHGSMLAGDRVWTKEPSGDEWGCSAGYGAYNYGKKPATNQQVLRMFFLISAHCGEEVPGTTSYRAEIPVAKPNERQKLGTIKRSGWDESLENVDLDIEAVRYENVHGIEPRRVFNPKEGAAPIPITSVGTVGLGTRVCHSGATTDENHPYGGRCGTVREFTAYSLAEERPPHRVHQLEGWCFDISAEEGDSGGPVWIEGTGIAVGLISAGDQYVTCFAPLLPDVAHPTTPSALTDLRLSPLDGLTLQP